MEIEIEFDSWNLDGIEIEIGLKLEIGTDLDWKLKLEMQYVCMV